MLRFLLLFLVSPLLANAMTLEEKVGQLLIVHFHGDASSLIKDVKVGGVIYYNWSNDLSTPEKVQALSNALQTQTSIPLFISIDQEGGPVIRLTHGFTEFPSSRALTKSDLETARAVATASAQELKAVGINMNLCPVVDVSEDLYSAIGIRTFGSDPEIVSLYAHHMLEGYNEEKIATTIKHFPGYGEVITDAHFDLPLLNKSQEEMWNHELIPYLKLAATAPCIMTGHIMVPSFDRENCATLSHTILEDILRKKIGFEGLIISDSLVMEGLLKNCRSIEEGAIRAINAGCDMLILGGKQLLGPHQDLELSSANIQKIADCLCKAVRRGVISEKRLDTAVARILKLKKEMGLFDHQLPTTDTIKDHVGTVAHLELAKKCSAKAVEVVKNGNFRLTEETLCIASTALKEKIAHSALNSYRVIYFNPFDPKPIVLPSNVPLVVCLNNAWQNPKQIAFLSTLLENRKTALLVLRDPIDATLFPASDTIITTLSSTPVSIDAALATLLSLNKSLQLR